MNQNNRRRLSAATAARRRGVSERFVEGNVGRFSPRGPKTGFYPASDGLIEGIRRPLGISGVDAVELRRADANAWTAMLGWNS